MKDGDVTIEVPKTMKDFDDVDKKKIEKNYKAKKILVCGIDPNEYNWILACLTTKQILDFLQTNHEETTQVKHSKVDVSPRKSIPRR